MVSISSLITSLRNFISASKNINNNIRKSALLVNDTDNTKTKWLHEASRALMQIFNVQDETENQQQEANAVTAAATMNSKKPEIEKLAASLEPEFEEPSEAIIAAKNFVKEALVCIFLLIILSVYESLY